MIAQNVLRTHTNLNFYRLHSMTEIYISNDKYYEQLVQYENEQELIEPLENEN